MSSIQDVIEALRTEPSNSERGTKFEQLMVRYFALDPLLAGRYDQVWRWIDWPGRAGKPDTGIDLVARERDTGALTAIQCKFYEPTTTLAKEHIDSFFTASGKTGFTNRIIISTTDRWGKNAEDALEGQAIPVQRIGLAEIADSPIDWDIAWPAGELHVEPREATRHEPRPHQAQAIDAVFTGFTGHDRGKLIMACGTGKTFTALKIVERLAAEQGGNARVLFAVPSISLLSQTMREWTAQTRLDLRAFAVCSDTKVSRAAEDINVHDVAIPVTTRPEVLAEQMGHRKRAKGLTVVFTTYQSLPVVAGAQTQGVDPFDLIICDEAHRTTGVTVAGGDESNFVRVHDADYLHATRRLYMTATPRIFDDNIKAKADEVSAELTSMDDETKYGPEFHRLSFGAAVERGLLTDYKVLVLTVDEELVAAPLQAQLASGTGELRLDDATKIVGCWNGLAKRAGRSPDGTGFAPGEAPMRRAVAFAQNIADSKKIRDLFPQVVDAYRTLLTDSENDGVAVDTTNLELNTAVRHVDGTFNALDRNRQLTWLKAPVPDGECRILSNARCLSEGVDVPALDAVMFLHPRSSVVDVVQSVGRVMRRSPDKDYGYIILPVAVPAGVAPSKALADNRRFRVVWQVLNALRAHDDRFNAMVNSIALNTTTTGAEKGQGSDQILGDHIGPTRPGPETPTEDAAPDSGAEARADDESTTATGDVGVGDATDQEAAGSGLAKQMALFALSEWQEAIFARIVDKVGTRTYWEDWARDVADIASALITRIRALLEGADPGVTAAFEAFVTGLRDNLNDSISVDDAISMLAQHLITRPVFDALFASDEFAAHNPVSQVMEAMLARLDEAGLAAETAHLEGFYASVRTRAGEVTTPEGKQQVIAELYERFFKLGFAKQADALGIVYTPVEIVDFILRAADGASRQAFGRGLSDEGVNVLDPFTGTGTFMTRLLQSGLIRPQDLVRKYASELYANDIVLLAYYIAAVNIETTYHALTGETYSPFGGIVLADTFQITEDGDTMDSIMFPQNNDRIQRELDTPIHVIVGNPPYSVGQTSANDSNANLRYPTLDKRITDTYAKRSTAQNKNSLYDSYIRAFRWATDRIGHQGVVAFVSNGGWVDGNTGDGMRLSLASEYATIYIYNLRGNQRTAGELSRKEGGKVFGAGSRNTVAVFVGVRDASHQGPCSIFYRDVGDYLSREEKLKLVAAAELDTLGWQAVVPNQYGDWVGQRNEDFGNWPPMGDKVGGTGIFGTHAYALLTARDAWVYNYSRTNLAGNVQRTIEFFNQQAEKAADTLNAGSAPSADALDNDKSRISWSSSLTTKALRGGTLTYSAESIVPGAYRPFQPQHLYFDRDLNHRVGLLPSMFPTPTHENVGIYVVGVGSDVPFSALMVDAVPNLHVTGAGSGGQFFPRWTYREERSDDGGLDFAAASGQPDARDGYRRLGNVTDATMQRYRETLGQPVTADDVFYSVYGQLHDPAYRQAYAADLARTLPRIPTPQSTARFEQLVEAGRALAELHLNYDTAEPYPLQVTVAPGADPHDRETWRVSKMKWATRGEHTAITYNPKVRISGIPEVAERYQIGSRSAVGWLLDRYQRKVDKPSGIVNDPNDWCDEHDDPRYIITLIEKVTTVAVRTMEIVDSLPAPEKQG